MRLDFNALWVDDQPDSVQSMIAGLRTRMAEEGFEFNANVCTSLDDVKGKISNSIFADEIDLILVDWDLGGGVRGQNAIAAIRDVIRFKEVVFYSGLTGAKELREAVFKNDLEGVYCIGRLELVEEVMGVFESLVKKVLDLDHTRGIVMGATSDIDHLVNQCLIVSIDRHLDDSGKAQVLENARGYVKQRLEDLTVRVAALESAATLADFFDAHMILTANDRLRLLGGLLKLPAFSSHKSYRSHITKYQQSVVPDRNILGHMVLVPEGRPTAVVDAGGQPISVEKTRELRRLILELRSQFRQLYNALHSVT